MINRTVKPFTTGFIACAIILLFSALTASAQEYKPIDVSKVPATASDPDRFVPADWKIESEVKGDLNADGLPDSVITLQETSAGDGRQRGRALVVLTALKDGTWKNAAIAGALLQCVECGDMMGELDITIEKGTVVIFQAQGRNGSSMGNETYRFRFERSTGRFRLIGADYVSSGGPDKVNSESTNYLTGIRKTTRAKGKRDITTSKKVKVVKTYLDGLEVARMDEAAFTRIGG